MRRIYIDTSTLLSKYLVNDPYSDESTKLSKLVDVRRICSYLTVVEPFSTLSRIIRTKKLQININVNEAKISTEKSIKLVVAYILKDWDLYIPPYSSDIVSISIDAMDILISREFASALQYSPLTRLKMLDNIHIAIASNINKQFFDIDYFITNDNGILNRRSVIKKFTNIEVVNPSEILELL